MKTPKLIVLALLGIAMIAVSTGTGFAQADAAASPEVLSSAYSRAAYFFGLAIVGLGAAFGLSRAVSAALESIARQPEAAGDIGKNMLIGCALIEALAIYTLISPFIALIALK